mmetsp:Transcript_147279/g.257308  ORF Transcript_147279/g.257308 Transcript_147279/m.257308 type:complete len:125 (-) Transcript_147279:434-808(-)
MVYPSRVNNRQPRVSPAFQVLQHPSASHHSHLLHSLPQQHPSQGYLLCQGLSLLLPSSPLPAGIRPSQSQGNRRCLGQSTPVLPMHPINTDGFKDGPDLSECRVQQPTHMREHWVLRISCSSMD